MGRYVTGEKLKKLFGLRVLPARQDVLKCGKSLFIVYPVPAHLLSRREKSQGGLYYLRRLL